MITINWITLLDIDSAGRFVVEYADWSTERIMMKWYADFIAWASNIWEEEIVWGEEAQEYEAQDEERKSFEDILADFEYNIRQEVKKENAIFLDEITKLINGLKNNKK